MNTEFVYDLEIENHILKVVVEASARFYRDRYGDDADGNRGEWRTEMDKLEVVVFDGRGKDITNKLYEKHAGKMLFLMDAAEAKLWEEHDDES